MIPDLIQELDANDSLAHKYHDFVIDSSIAYMDGNSLGPLTTFAQARTVEVVQQQWGGDLISSWNKHNWIDLPLSVGDKIAPIIGAAKGQVVCCDSVSVNIFKLLSSALALQPDRDIIVSLDDNFPTDLYMAQGMSRLLGSERCVLETLSIDRLLARLDSSVAVLLLTEVNFRSGERLDMRAITQAAHAHDIMVIWDLSHSTGAVPLELDACEVDFAVGCGYKFLNGGPGAPAFIYLNERWADKVEQALCGWMGHAAPFEFDPEYQAAKGVRKFLSGTPNILSLAALDASLEVFDGLAMEQLRDKSIALSELFLQLIEQAEELASLRCISPRDPHKRGSQLSFAHPDAFAICQALIANGVIADFRAPDLLRFGFTPLYQRYADIWVVVEKLKEIMTSGSYHQPEFQRRGKVT